MNEPPPRRGRIAVLVSGNGSNLQALIDAVETNALEVEIVVVASNRSDAFGLERARQAQIPTISPTTVPLPAEGEERSTYDRRLAEAVAAYAPDVVVLAGWMRILTMEFLGRFPVLNLHPAKPGAFPGIHAIERAFSAWGAGEVDESGVMVHWVPDEGVDSGPVIAWEPVGFEAGDTIESFEARLRETEHRLLVAAVATATATVRTHQEPVSS